MYSQFFGSYLLSREAITQEQLMAAISRLSSTKIKIGTIAMNDGLMTAAEVDECLFVQTREDKRFGEIALERGYLTQAQVDELLNVQVADYLLLGQTLVEDGCFSNQDLQNYIFDYHQDTEIFDLDLCVETNERVQQIIRKFFIQTQLPVNEKTTMYLELVFHSLIRFIGDDFTPLAPLTITEYPVSFAVSQTIVGSRQYTTSIDMDRDTAIEFASRYANDEFSEFNEYVMASVEDFLNLHNGLFLVNMSNEDNAELELFPPTINEGEILDLADTSLVIPIVYPFGRLNLIVSF